MADGEIAEDKNLKTGIQSMKLALETCSDVIGAMQVDGVGAIDFLWGEAGTPSKGFQDGYGLSHIIARRSHQGQNGVEAVEHLPHVLALGIVGQPYGPANGRRLNVTLGDATAVVSLHHSGEQRVWLLTGWKEKTGLGGARESINPSSYTP
jgi:phage-Barnase-EndoU-ColicinE5/D-RelE like nuclease1